MQRNICQIEALTLPGDIWLDFLWQNLVYETSWHFRVDNRCNLTFISDLLSISTGLCSDPYPGSKEASSGSQDRPTSQAPWAGP